MYKFKLNQEVIFNDDRYVHRDLVGIIGIIKKRSNDRGKYYDVIDNNRLISGVPQDWLSGYDKDIEREKMIKEIQLAHIIDDPFGEEKWWK